MATSIKNQETFTLVYETCCCGRCGGTGKYHVSGYGPRVCFKCRGLGRIFSPRGNYARGAVRKIKKQWATDGVDQMSLNPTQIEQLRGIKGLTVTANNGGHDDY